MIGKQTELIYQEQSETSDGAGGYIISWYGKRKIKGNLMLDMDREAFNEMFKQDKRTIKKRYVFVPRKPIGIDILESGRFIEEKTGLEFDIRLVDNPGNTSNHTEIWLQEIK